MPTSALLRAPWLPFVLLLAAQLPWLARPVDFDEANFTVLARGAAADPLRPHAIPINWTGNTRPAFEVLSNPPGVAWWLAPVAGAPVALQRAWMLPWFALCVLGARRLGRRFGDGDRTALLLLAPPIALLSIPALMPDAPLYACTLAGVAGAVDAVDRRERGVAWGLVAGCAALFRYSGVTLVPLLALYALQRRRAPWAALAAAVPVALLTAHDVAVYGQSHLAAMTEFQSVSNTAAAWHHKAVSALAMLGGAAVLPIFAWGAPAVAGAIAGALATLSFGAVAALFAAAGNAVLATALAAPLRAGDGRRDRLWLAAWAGGGFVFLLSLRFAATRYWMPFLPGILLALPFGRLRTAWLAASIALGAALAADGFAQARAVERLAARVATLAPHGYFTGHWGWQAAMEARGWEPIELYARAPAGALVALVRQAWPQAADIGCSDVVWQSEADAIPWLPRSYTEAGRANLHGHALAPSTRSVVAPWSFASDPYEAVVVCREQRPDASGRAAAPPAANTTQ
ncbi:MAG: hypothetical protein DCC71_09430 [Proteobacteria bacterium]|nr:MAG: hypothetical protein DCC71_09430 [Pseudomonadota bacterium]